MKVDSKELYLTMDLSNTVTSTVTIWFFSFTGTAFEVMRYLYNPTETINNGYEVTM
jgi:hypothetical protein